MSVRTVRSIDYGQLYSDIERGMPSDQSSVAVYLASKKRELESRLPAKQLAGFVKYCQQRCDDEPLGVHVVAIRHLLGSGISSRVARSPSRDSASSKGTLNSFIIDSQNEKGESVTSHIKLTGRSVKHITTSDNKNGRVGHKEAFRRKGVKGNSKTQFAASLAARLEHSGVRLSKTDPEHGPNRMAHFSGTGADRVKVVTEKKYDSKRGKNVDTVVTAFPSEQHHTSTHRWFRRRHRGDRS